MKKKLISREAVLELPPYEKFQNLLSMPIRFARSIFLNRLGDIREGLVEVREGEAKFLLGQEENPGPRAVIEVLDPDFYFSVVFGGSIGVAESYMDGLWRTDNLTTLIRIFLMNRDLIYKIETGLSWLTNPIYSLTHRKKRNTKTGSRANSHELFPAISGRASFESSARDSLQSPAAPDRKARFLRRQAFPELPASFDRRGNNRQLRSALSDRSSCGSCLHF